MTDNDFSNQNTTTNPQPGGMFYAIVLGKLKNLMASTKRLILVAIIAGILLPPIGLLLALLILYQSIRQKKKAFLIIGLVGLIAVAVGTSTYVNLWDRFKYRQAYSYSYQSLDDYSLPSKLEGAGVTFKKPVEFTERSKDVLGGLSTAIFAHVNDRTNPKTGLAYMATSLINSVAPSFEPSYIVAINKLLQIHQGKDYEAFIDPLKKYLQNNLPTGLQIDFGSPMALSTGNIKKDAWQFDFWAKDNKSNAKERVSQLRGKFMLVLGKKTFYYFMISSINHNWQSNQAVWQQVIDSVKIDQ